MKTSFKTIRSAGAHLSLLILFGLFTSLLVLRNNEPKMDIIPLALEEDENLVKGLAEEEQNNNDPLIIDYSEDLIEPEIELESWMFQDNYYDNSIESEPELESWMFEDNYYGNLAEPGPEFETWMFDNSRDDEILKISPVKEVPDFDVLDILRHTAIFPGI